MSMNIEKRTWKTKAGTKTAWRVNFMYTNPRGERVQFRKVAPGSSKREATDWGRLQLRLALSGELDRPPESIPTFKQFVEEQWIPGHLMVHCKPSTQRTRKSALNSRILPRLGERRLDLIGMRDIASFIAHHQAHGRKAKTINNYLGIISSILNVASDWGAIEHVPKIKWLKSPKPQFRFLMPGELVDVLDHVNPLHWDMTLCAARTGMRLGEMLALRWSHIDWDRELIMVCQSATRGKITSTKSGKSRDIPMTPDLVEVLQARYVKMRRSPFVFCREDGSLWTDNALSRVLPAAAKAAGIESFRWHVLRHTYASHMVMAGAPLKVIQELLGHATLEMTMRYAHLAPSAKTEAVARLASLTKLSPQSVHKKTPALQLVENTGV